LSSAQPDGRRVGKQTSKTRARLLDTTVAIMLEEGYAAVTSRQVALRSGVQAPLVHYYFPVLDDLFIAAFRRGAEQNLARLHDALDDPNPLQGLWRYSNEPTGVVLMFEFLALSNHRKALRAEIAAEFTKFRELELKVVTDAMSSAGVDLKRYPPEAVLQLLLTAPAGLMQQQQLLGITAAHQATLSLIEQLLAETTGIEITRGKPKRKRRAAPRNLALNEG
jgi:AcrR family transcriptional regulator